MGIRVRQRQSAIWFDQSNRSVVESQCRRLQHRSPRSSAVTAARGLELARAAGALSWLNKGSSYPNLSLSSRRWSGSSRHWLATVAIPRGQQHLGNGHCRWFTRSVNMRSIRSSAGRPGTHFCGLGDALRISLERADTACLLLLTKSVLQLPRSSRTRSTCVHSFTRLLLRIRGDSLSPLRGTPLLLRRY